MGHGSVRQKLALDMGPIIVGSCTTGDPMCVEPWERLPSALSKMPRSEGSPAGKAAKRSHFPVQPESTTAHDEVLPAPPKSAARQDPEGVKTRQTHEGWEYDFDGDPMSAWNRFSDMIRGDGMRKKTSVACFEPFTTALTRPDATREDVLLANVKMLRCADPCLTVEEAQILTGCMDWETLLSDPTERLRPAAAFFVSAANLMGLDVANAMESTLEQLSLDHLSNVLEGRVKTECTEEEIDKAMIEQGLLLRGLYEDKDGRCQPPERTSLLRPRRAEFHWVANGLSQRPDYRGIVEKLSKGYSATHQCPQDLNDIEVIRSMTRTIMAAGYDTEPVPKDGITCGYNSSQKKWYQLKFSCESTTRCFTQGRKDLPPNCSEFTRASITDQLFVKKGQDCAGLTASWRYGGISGDMRLIRIASNTWLEIFESPKDGQFYIGLTFSDEARE